MGTTRLGPMFSDDNHATALPVYVKAKNGVF
jgi:hypothetical protein